ncbi:MAG: site-specific integrase [Mogibacterium sp.]|nr:site-specific integrase [Mogibacterium sp.]
MVYQLVIIVILRGHEVNKTCKINTTEYSDSFVLSQLYADGKIDVSDVEEVVKLSKLENAIKPYHKNRIYRDDRGRWCTYVRDERKKSNRRQISKTHKADLLEELYRIYLDEDYVLEDKTTVAKLYPKWLEYKSKHTRAQPTIDRYCTDWNKYYKDQPIAKCKIVDLTKLQLDEWAHENIKKYDMTSTQFSNMSTILRQMLDYAVDLGIIQKNVFRDVQIEKRMFRRVHKKTDEESVYSYEEQKQIFKMAWLDFTEHSCRFTQKLAPLAVMFQFLTGLRVSELCAIRYEDIASNEKGLMIRRMVRRDAKEVVDNTKGTFGDREVMLATEAKYLIDVATEYKKEHGYQTDGYIFSVTDSYLTYRSVTDLFLKYCKKLGIPPKGSHGSRRAFISTLLDAGVNINTVRTQVGHKDERTTLHNYAHSRYSKDEKWNVFDEIVSGTVEPMMGIMNEAEKKILVKQVDEPVAESSECEIIILSGMCAS